MNVPLSLFWRRVVTVLTGTMVAQALPLLLAPLITRICSPQEMGTFSVWLAVVQIASIVATLRLETAMILDHDSTDQRTCFSVIASFSLVLAMVITLCAVLARQLGLPSAVNMSWFGLMSIGVGMWLAAYTNTIVAYATSYNAFGKAAQAKVWGAGTIVLSQVVLLLSGAGSIGLIAGQIIGLSCGLIAAFHLLSPPRPRLSLWPSERQCAYLMKHAAFWRFALPADLLNVVAGKLPLFMIGLKFGLLEAGLFALTQRVLAAPTSLLAASVLEVFKRQSVQEWQTVGNCRDAFAHTFKALALLGALPALLMITFAPDLFALLFGESWRHAGEYARIMSPLYFLNFIVSPLSYVFYVVGKQRVDLVWQVALFAMTTTVFLSPLTLEQCLWWYTCGYSLLYLIYLALSYRFAQPKLSLA
jgi:O-antigen/teichoic acid export membrane protein